MDPCPLCGTVATRITTSAGEVVRCACTAGAPTARGSGAWQSWRRNVAHRASGKAPDAKHTTDITPDAIEDTPETRTAHIASKIAECAKASKREACDLTWEDFRAYGSIAWGDNSLGIVRRDITRLGGFNAIRDAHFAKRGTPQAVARTNTFEASRLNRETGKILTSEAAMFQRIEEFSKNIFRGALKPIRARTAPKENTLERELLFLLGDIHAGSNISGREVRGPSYGIVEEARRGGQCVAQVASWKPEYRKNTGLTVMVGGDLIDGEIHPNHDRAVLAEQQMRAYHVLSMMVARLAESFCRVRVHCVSGNHERDVATNPKPALINKWNSHATMIYVAARDATAKFGNVSWEIPLSASATFEILGHRFYSTHGDTEFKVPGPGGSVNVENLEAEASRLNDSLPPEQNVEAVLLFHHHAYLHVRPSSSTQIIINGGYQPLTAFARSIGRYSSISTQTLFEVTRGHAVGDIRTITLDAAVDKNAKLDKIIPPWKGP